MKRKKLGRPQVVHRREAVLRVLVTEAEQLELQQAASESSMSLSTWLRSVGLERARQLRSYTSSQS